MKVFINPGHGNDDGGATGYGLNEKDVTLNIGNSVQKYLDAANIKTLLVQDELEIVCAESNDWGADIFVSIHCNAATGAGHGTETYHFPGSYKGNALATAVQRKICSYIPELTNRGVKTANFYVLKHTIAPAILVETAFIDNKFDNLILKNRAGEIAKAIAFGVLEYAGLKPDIVENPNL